jgi:hypothetical protein
VIVPLIVTSGPVPQAVGRLKFVVVVPPLKFVVNVKLAVPHVTVGSVDILKGTELKPVPSITSCG